MRGRVLVLGIELRDDPSLAASICFELGRPGEWEVEQRWLPIRRPYAPKFTLLNMLLRGIEDKYEFIVIADDDVNLPPNFLDRYLRIVEQRGFALAQPARTHGSTLHHPIVEQVNGLEARETRFVEIGPLFSMRRDAVPLLTPFDETSPMGWGYEFVWSRALAERGLKLGIVDATPVEHSFRPVLSLYDGAREGAIMADYLSKVPHISRSEAYTTVERFPL